MRNGFSDFGIGFLAGNELSQMVKMAQEAESKGFTHCWIAEDYFFGGAFSTATACAMNTSSIEIGIGVINPYTRHPALTAMELGALDYASNGRAIFGIGASNIRWIQEQMGIPFAKPLTATKECVEIVSNLLLDREVVYKGSVFDTGRIHLEFEPLRPRIPVYMGVKGPKALELAGEIADGVLTSIMTSAGYVRYAVEHIKQGAHNAGRDISGIKVAGYLAIYVSRDRAEAREAVKPMIAKYLGIHGIHPILTTAGMKEAEIMPFREALIQGRLATDMVTDWMIDTFAIAGTPDECRSKLKDVVDAGINRPIAFEIPGIPIQETIRQITEYLM